MNKKSFEFILLISTIILCGLPGLFTMFIGSLMLFDVPRDALGIIGIGIILIAVPIGVFVLFYLIKKPKHQVQTQQTNLSSHLAISQNDDRNRTRIEQEIRNLNYQEKLTGTTVAVSALQKISGVRTSAAIFLGDSGDAQAVEPLIAALKYKDKISDLIDSLPSNIGDYTVVLGAVVAALGKLRDARAVEPLIAVAPRMMFRIGDVAKALEQIGEPAVKSLIVALKNDNYNIRRVAACFGKAWKCSGC